MADARRAVRVGLVGLGNVGVGHHLPAFESMPELARGSDAPGVELSDRRPRPRPGVLDRFRAALAGVGYDGSLSIEHEDRTDDPLAGVEQSAAVARTILAARSAVAG